MSDIRQINKTKATTSGLNVQALTENFIVRKGLLNPANLRLKLVQISRTKVAL